MQLVKNCTHISMKMEIFDLSANDETGQVHGMIGVTQILLGMRVIANGDGLGLT